MQYWCISRVIGWTLNILKRQLQQTNWIFSWYKNNKYAKNYCMKGISRSRAASFHCETWDTKDILQNPEFEQVQMQIGVFRNFDHLKNVVTIWINEIFMCHACYSQKIKFVAWKSRQSKHKLCEKKQRRWTGNNFFKVIFTTWFNQLLFVIIHK